MARRNRISTGALAAVLAAGAAPAAADAAQGDHCHPAPTQARYLRSVHRYRLPDVALVDQDGRRVPLAEALEPGSPVAVNFVFTTCTTICPVMSATFSGLRRKLGDEAPGLRMVSISIDPEHDRPEVLKAYAARFGADPAWRFYTGGAGDIRALLTAFEASFGDKANHRPLTLFRRAKGRDWVRIEGLASAEELAGELRELRAEK
jgi:protein SCO1/2